MDIQGSKVEAVFQIPLRFHSAKISLTVDTANPDKGIDLYAEIFGHNSFQRWDQATAYISFIAEKCGLSFANGIGPKIDYNKPTGVSFNLHIDQKNTTQTKLIDSIEYIYQTLSMIEFEGVKAVNALLEKMKSEGDPPSFDHVSEQFFQPALFLNMSLLNKYHQEKNDAMVLKIAKNALLGLARHGLHDYTRSGVEIWGLQEYLAQTDYGYVPNNESNDWNSKRSLKRTAILHLIRSLENNVSGAREAADVLVKDPDLIKQIPETVEALKVALFKTQPAETQYQELMKQGKYEEAFLLAVASDARLQEFSRSLKAINKIETLAVLKKLCATYYHGSYKKKIDTLIKDLKRTKELKKFKSSSSRQASRTKLATNVKKMQSLVATFDANAGKILDLSVSALIGLSQTESWEHASFGDFEGLNGYLGDNKTYPYAQPLPNSKKQSTVRLMTAGPLYIIKCFEKLKEKGQLKNGALKSIDKLFEDYFAYGCHSLHANHYKKALFIISKGFYETSDDKESARAKLNQWWGKDPTQADSLKDDPFNLKL
ncbi:MAG: hypothetical protein ACE5DO_14350 [Desulfobacterales bacterium]